MKGFQPTPVLSDLAKMLQANISFMRHAGLPLLLQG